MPEASQGGYHRIFYIIFFSPQSYFSLNNTIISWSPNDGACYIAPNETSRNLDYFSLAVLMQAANSDLDDPNYGGGLCQLIRSYSYIQPYIYVHDFNKQLSHFVLVSSFSVVRTLSCNIYMM